MLTAKVGPVTTGARAALLRPQVGRDYLRARAVLGLSVAAVAAELRISRSALQRWEASAGVIDEELAVEWREALSRAAAWRLDNLAAGGLSLADLRGTDLGLVLKSYVGAVR